MGLYTGVGRKKGGILGGPLLPAGWLARACTVLFSNINVPKKCRRRALFEALVSIIHAMLLLLAIVVLVTYSKIV